MASDWPKIKARRTTTVSPWMTIIEREVEFTEGANPELYPAVGQQDYIAIVALETGLTALVVHALGAYAPCMARLSNRVHSFFVATEPRAAAGPRESGIELRLVSPAELAGLILSGEFVLQLHIGALLLAGLRGHIGLGTLKTGR
jgi:ADP-ribose pyrophosphatase